jgi:hypothetical protein
LILKILWDIPTNEHVPPPVIVNIFWTRLLERTFRKLKSYVKPIWLGQADTEVDLGIIAEHVVTPSGVVLS